MKHAITALALGLFIGIIPASAQKTITLDQAISLAVEHNQSLKNAKLDEKIAQNEVKSILATGLPQISGGANFTANPQPQVTPVISDEFGGPIPGVDPTITTLAFGRPMQVAASVNLSQLLFDGAYFLGVKAAKEYVNMAHLTALKSAQDVKVEITNAYFLTVLSEQNINQIKQNVVQTQKMLSETEALFKEGLVEKTDVDRLELALANLNNQVQLLENNLKVSLLSLKMKLGLKDLNEIKLVTPLPTQNNESLVNTSFDPNKRIEQQMLNQQISLQELNVKRFKVSRYPSLYLSANHQQQSVYFDREEFNDEFLSTWYPGTAVGVNLSIPIFNGFYTKTQIQKSQNQLSQVKNTAEQTSEMLLLDYTNSKLIYAQKHQAYLNQKKSVELASNIFKTTQIKYKEGVSSSFELIQAQQELINAQIQSVTAAYEMVVAQTNLKKALGQF